jgi:hypothetical protein
MADTPRCGDASQVAWAVAQEATHQLAPRGLARAARSNGRLGG